MKNPDAAKAETGFMYPHFLPDGMHFLYWASFKEAQARGLFAGLLDSQETKRIPDVPSRVEYADGYLFYGSGEDLFARPFDLNRLEFTGPGKRIGSGLGWIFDKTADCRTPVWILKIRP